MFNDRVCFRSSITSFGNVSWADGRANLAVLPLPMLIPSPHHGVLRAPQPSAFCKDAGEQKISVHAKSTEGPVAPAQSPSISLMCPSAGCGGQNAP